MIWSRYIYIYIYIFICLETWYPENKMILSQSGMKLELEVRGVTLLLVACSDSGLRLYCLTAKGFFNIFIIYLFFFLCVWLLLSKEKIILFTIFYWAGLFVFDKIGWLSLIFFSFIISNFCCWANFFGLVYFVSIFLWPLKGRKY